MDYQKQTILGRFALANLHAKDAHKEVGLHCGENCKCGRKRNLCKNQVNNMHCFYTIMR